jgi:hypothetical protein
MNSQGKNGDKNGTDSYKAHGTSLTVLIIKSE